MLPILLVLRAAHPGLVPDHAAYRGRASPHATDLQGEDLPVTERGIVLVRLPDPFDRVLAVGRRGVSGRAALGWWHLPVPRKTARPPAPPRPPARPAATVAGTARLSFHRFPTPWYRDAGFQATVTERPRVRPFNTWCETSVIRGQEDADGAETDRQDIRTPIPHLLAPSDRPAVAPPCRGGGRRVGRLVVGRLYWLWPTTADGR